MGITTLYKKSAAPESCSPAGPAGSTAWWAAKPLDQYLAILDAYADQGIESHWDAVPPVAQERISGPWRA
jgi:hypothetical protein